MTTTPFFEAGVADEQEFFKLRRAADRSRTCRRRRERYVGSLQAAVNGITAPSKSAPYGAARSAARGRLASGVIEVPMDMPAVSRGDCANKYRKSRKAFISPLLRLAPHTRFVAGEIDDFSMDGLEHESELANTLIVKSVDVKSTEVAEAMVEVKANDALALKTAARVAVEESLALKTKADEELLALKARVKMQLGAQRPATKSLQELFAAKAAMLWAPVEKAAVTMGMDDKEWQMVDSPSLAPVTNPLPTDEMPLLSLAEKEDDDVVNNSEWAMLVL